MRNKVKFKNKIIFLSSTNIKFAMDDMEIFRKFPSFSLITSYHPLSYKNTANKLQSFNKALVIDMCWITILKALQMNHLYIKFLEWTLINTWNISNHVLKLCVSIKRKGPGEIRFPSAYVHI
jgi:hypothetical protein